MKKTLTFLLLFVCSSFLNISITSACDTTTSSNWTVSDCAVPSSNTTTVINTSKSGIGPSPYITRIENTTLGKSNGGKRVYCSGDRSVNTSGSNFTSSCSTTSTATPPPSCTTTQSGGWLMSNCAVPSTNTTTVIDQNKSGNGPSPYITTISNTTLGNLNGGKRYYCSGRRSIDTTGGKYSNSCYSAETLTPNPPVTPVNTCNTTTSDNWTVSDCTLNSGNTTTVINTAKSGTGPSPYITSIENTSLGKTNGGKRVYCPGARSVDTTGSNFISTCSSSSTTNPDCSTTTVDNWTVSNCPLGMFDNYITVKNELKSGNGPSPYIKSVENTSLGKSNEGKRVKCAGNRSIDTSGSNFISICYSVRNEQYNKTISISPELARFTAVWENDTNAVTYSYFLKIENSNTILKQGTVTTNTLTIEGLQEGETYNLQVIARGINSSPLGQFNGKTTTLIGSKGSLYISALGGTGIRAYWYNKIKNVTRYKLDAYSSADNKLVSTTDYNGSNNSGTDCLLSSNFGKLEGCAMYIFGLSYATDYKAILTAYSGSTVLQTLEGDSVSTKYEEATLKFSDIRGNGFTFTWESRPGISMYYYDIYDETNKKQIITGMYTDGINLSYNTITGKYKNFTGFPLVYNTKYSVKVHGYIGSRNIIVYSGEVTTDGDGVNMITTEGKLQMESILPKIKTINLNDSNKYTSLVTYLSTYINGIDLSTDTGKIYKNKAVYLKTLIENVIQKKQYFTLSSSSSVTFQDITSDGFTIKRNKASSNPSKYYISIYDSTNSKNLITGMYEDTLTYIYNTKTGKYKNSYKIESCTKYDVEVSYNNGGTSYVKYKSSVVTSGCEDINTLVINTIKGLTSTGTTASTTTSTGSTISTLGSSATTTTYIIQLTDNIKVKLDKFVSDYVKKFQNTSTKNDKISNIVIKLELLKVDFEQYGNVLQYLIDKLNQNKN